MKELILQTTKGVGANERAQKREKKILRARAGESIKVSKVKANGEEGKIRKKQDLFAKKTPQYKQ